MLSQLAQASRLGLRAAHQLPRFSTTTSSSTAALLRTRPVIASTFTPLSIRTFAKGRGRGPAGNVDKPKPQSQSEPPSTSDPQYAAPQSVQDDATAAKSAQEAKEADLKDAEDQIAFDKLPDLTQGIPSTFAQEMDEKMGKTDSALQVSPQEDGRQRRGGGGGGRDDYVSSSEQNFKWWTRFMLITALGGGLFGVGYMGRNWDDEEEAKKHADIPDGWSPLLWWQRSRARMGESISYYQDPAFDKLLPDPDPSFERPYTLCISLDDLLVHSEWSREHGWRVAKRPGVDYFIRYLSQYYELVLFTTVPFAMGDPLVRKLDPFRFIIWPLYREATKYEDGEVVKDLSYLNRDLSKVIIIDNNARHVRKQPENAIVLDPWTGDRNDKELVGLIPFLEYIHTMQYSDVRKVLKSFEGKHIPTEFSRREAIARKEFNAQLAAKRKSNAPSGFAALGSALGLKPSSMSMTMAAEGEQNPSEAFAQGKMLQDLARERGQRHYEILEKEIRENGAKWLKEEQEAMEKAQQEAMNSMMGSFGGWFTPKKEAGSDGEPKKS